MPVNLMKIARINKGVFYFKDEILHEISEKIQDELVRGLEFGASKSSIAMLPSFVPALPDGNG